MGHSATLPDGRSLFAKGAHAFFAILGLRSLFFALAGLMQMFHYLHYGLAAVLVFVGGKMLYGYVEKDVWAELPKFPVWLSLVVIVVTIALAVVVSILRPPKTSATVALKEAEAQ